VSDEALRQDLTDVIRVRFSAGNFERAADLIVTALLPAIRNDRQRAIDEALEKVAGKLDDNVTWAEHQASKDPRTAYEYSIKAGEQRDAAELVRSYKSGVLT
jgi:hypothetical protein